MDCSTHLAPWPRLRARNNGAAGMGSGMLSRTSPPGLAIPDPIRSALRQVHRRPWASLAAVLLLSAAIWAPVSIYGVYNQAVLRPLPFPEPSQIVLVGGAQLDSAHGGLQWWERSRTVGSLSIYHAGMAQIRASGPGIYAPACAVSPHFFNALQTPTLFGRWLGPSDFSRPDPVVVLSLAVARRLFGQARRALGSTVTVEGSPALVVGVMPQDFLFPGHTDIWIPGRGTDYGLPLGHRDHLSLRDGADFGMFGRLSMGATLDAARAEFYFLLRSLGARSDQVITVRTLLAAYDARYGGILRLLFCAALLLFLVCSASACAIVQANAMDRSHEISLRATLGSGRSHIAAQALASSLIVALPGVLAGVALTVGTARWFAAITTNSIPGLTRVSFAPGEFLGIAMAGTLLLACCALPTVWYWQRVAAQPSAAARDPQWPSSTFSRFNFLAVQVAIAFALAALGSGVLLRLALLSEADNGFQLGDVGAIQIHLPVERLPPGSWTGGTRASNWRDFVLHLAGTPYGKSLPAFADNLPLAAAQTSNWYKELSGPRPGADGMARSFRGQGSLLSALNVQLVAGHHLEEEGNQLSEPEVVVSESLALRLADNPQQAIGVEINWEGRTQKVVGVARGIALIRRGDKTTEAVYSNFASGPPRASEADGFIVVGLPGGQAPLNQLAYRIAQAGIPVLSAGPLSTIVGQSDRPLQLELGILWAAALVALPAAMVTISVLTRRAAESRRHEMAVRVAMGAPPSAVAGLLVREGASQCILGLVLGFVLLIGAQQAARHRLTDFPSAPNWLVAVVAALLLLCCFVVATASALLAANSAPSALLREL